MKQMFIPNSLQVKMIEKDKSKHMRRLDEILTQDRKAKIVEKDVNSTLKLSNTRQNNLKLSHKGKANELEQENELLLGKLVEISRKKSPNFQIRSESANGKSLHAPYKKREMMRISSENEAFAKRLISQQSTFNRKKLDTDFRKHKEMVGNLKRIHSSPGKNLGKKILPPIKSELTSPKAVSLKQSEVRSSLVKENKETQKEQPQQESTIVPSTIANDNKDVVTPVVPEKKEEAKPKENETVQANAVKQENTTSVLEASNLQKSQEVPENPAQENKSQRVENAEVKVENANNETVNKEEK